MAPSFHFHSFLLSDGHRGKSCVEACIVRKKKIESINGVTVFKDGRQGCWCEVGMTHVVESQQYNTCFLKKRLPFGKLK